MQNPLPTPRLRRFARQIAENGEGGRTVYELGKMNPSLHSGSVQATCNGLVKLMAVKVGSTTDPSRMSRGDKAVNLYVARSGDAV